MSFSSYDDDTKSISRSTMRSGIAVVVCPAGRDAAPADAEGDDDTAVVSITDRSRTRTFVFFVFCSIIIPFRWNLAKCCENRWRRRKSVEKQYISVGLVADGKPPSGFRTTTTHTFPTRLVVYLPDHVFHIRPRLLVSTSNVDGQFAKGYRL